MAATIVMAVFFLALGGWAVWRTAYRVRKGGGCCGDREAAPVRQRAEDRNKAHYPHERIADIGGMTCENCAIRVENALNALPDTWARVSIATKQALIRTKAEPDEETIRRAVASAGYAVMNIRRP